MCVTTDKAELTGTTLVLTTCAHPESGEVVHSVTYRNTVQNLSDGPNCMLLHLPSREPMTEENVIATTDFKGYVDDIEEALWPQRMLGGTRGRSKSLSCDSAVVHIFDVDVYTIVMSQSIEAAYSALNLVRADRRPRIKPSLKSFYASNFSDNCFAYCCFNNREARKAAPLLFWYYPKNKNVGVLPAIDSHDGNEPNIGEFVETDHKIIFGSQLHNPGMCEVRYYLDSKVPEHLKWLFPKWVIGRKINQKTKNADFLIDINKFYETGNFVLHKGFLSGGAVVKYNDAFYSLRGKNY
jgi:hypothetical protein